MNRSIVGWIISLWIDTTQEQLNERKNFPYLSWSPYDRVTVTEINTFSQFFKLEDTVSWNGTVQRLHLIPMKKDFNWKPDDTCLIQPSDMDVKRYGLYCIVTARLKKRVTDIKDVKERICRKISQILQDRVLSGRDFIH